MLIHDPSGAHRTTYHSFLFEICHWQSVTKVTKPNWLCHFAVNFAVNFDMATKLCDELLMDQHASLRSIQRVGHKRSGKYIHNLRFLQDLTGLWQQRLVKFGVMHQEWRLPPLFDQCQALSLSKWQSDKQPCFVTLTAKLATKVLESCQCLSLGSVLYGQRLSYKFP